MNATEKVCLKLCQEIFTAFSVAHDTSDVLNYSVRLVPVDVDKIAEVILVTKDDEYTFLLDVPKEVYNENDSHLSKRDSKNKYNLKRIQIKGYDAVEFGAVDLQDLKNILEKLAEYHANSIKVKNIHKNNYKTEHFSAEDKKEAFIDVLQKILDQIDEESIDRNIFTEGVKTIEDSFGILFKSNEEYVFVNGAILENKIFIKNTETPVRDCRILSFRNEHNFPLVYDLLLTIFSLTDQNMRQYFFHDLLEHYYRSLKDNLQELSLDITKCLPTTTFEEQINKFLPCVKLQILKQLCRLWANEKISRELEKMYNTIHKAILEVNECILFPNLSREDCYKIIRNKIGSSDYNFLNYRLIPLQEREGFLGDYFKLKIEIELDGVFKLFHFFAKSLPTHNDMAIDVAVESFKKEEFYYFEFIPELNDFGLEDITNFLPKCYFSRTNDVLILQDIIMENYRTLPMPESYTYEMLSLAVKQLAKVHASSLLYEELSSEKAKKNIRIDEKYPKYVEEKNVLNKGESLIKLFFDCAFRTSLNILNIFPEIPKDMSLEEFKERSTVEFNLCFEKVKKSDKFRNVLCHGDCWATNILFRNDENNSPVNCLLVDYQLTRYCPPAHDIYYLLYMTTTKQTRAKFESKLLQEYYYELSNILQRHKVDLQTIYTYQQFLDCCNYMKSQGLCHAIMILQFVLFPKEKMKNILKNKEQSDDLFYKNREIFIEELQYEGPYGQRMRELIEDLYEICENINS